MNKTLNLFVFGLMLSSMAACQPIALPDAQTQYCDDLVTYQKEMQDVKSLPENATVEDLETALEEVEDAFNALDDSVWDLADAQNEALDTAYQEMRASVDEITGDTPTAEAKAIIEESVSTYLATIQEVMEVNCVGDTVEATVEAEPTATP